MLGIKPFVQESVQTLPPAQLRLLAETLRIDLRGCEDRRDIERVLTGLVCLDQDTSLGVFLAWLRSTDTHQHRHGLLTTKKPTFHTTFLPAISSSPEVHSVNNQQKSDLNEQMKDHHLDDEIQLQLSELQVLEASFKTAERLLHTGPPSFEKLKQFLLDLTILRAKEQTTRVFLVQQAHVLRKQHEEMRAEMLHSRAQLDFFVEGFTNLRKRHDALLTEATRMKAENETTQEIFLSMSAHDCCFEQLLRNTLWKQMQDNDEMTRRLQLAHEDLDAAAQKRKILEAQLSQLKQERGEARKDASCFKRQLRVCKTRMRRLEQAGGGLDGSFFREQAVTLRQTVATLVGLLRDAVVKDTKSAKQTLSKETLRILHQVLTPDVSIPENEAPSSRVFQTGIESEEVDAAQPRIVHRRSFLDIDEVIRGVLLVEGATPTYAAECAQILSQKLKYLPVDLKQTLTQLQQDEETRAQAAREQEQGNLHPGEGSGTSGHSDTSVAAPVLPAPAGFQLPPTLEAFAGALLKHISDLMAAQNKRGFVMYNWPFSRHDVNILTAVGLSVDSVMNLESVVASAHAARAPTPIATSAVATLVTLTKPKTPVSAKTATQPSSSNTSRAKVPVATSAARSKASPMKPTATSKSPPSRTAVPSAAATKPRAGSPTRALATAKKAPTTTPRSPSRLRTPSTPVNSGFSSTLQPKPNSSEAVRPAKKVLTAASTLQGLGGILQPIGPAAFPAERVDVILRALEQQKRRKLAPVVHWDEQSRRTNEMLAMWAEEVHMLVHLEQQSRKPHRAATPTPVPSSSRSTTASPVRDARPSKPTTSRAARAPSKEKPASLTYKSPTKANITSTKAKKEK